MRRILIGVAIVVCILLILSAIALNRIVAATATPQIVPRIVAHPDSQIQARAWADPGRTMGQLDLAYEDMAHPNVSNPACSRTGRWSLEINPTAVIGHPYATAPSAREWARAAGVIAEANAICPAATVLAWYGHDPAHPSSDRWTAILPVSMAATADGRRLRAYALAHARQL